jgi:hypothetical protein
VAGREMSISAGTSGQVAARAATRAVGSGLIRSWWQEIWSEYSGPALIRRPVSARSC